MNTTTHTAKRLSSTTHEYRGIVITRQTNKYSARTAWVFSFGGREYFANTLRWTKVMLDFAIDHGNK